jgi:hypothetical protein
MDNQAQQASVNVTSFFRTYNCFVGYAVGLNVVYTSVDLIANKADHHDWMLQPPIAFVTYAVGGVFAIFFVADFWARWARHDEHDLRWKWTSQTSIEKVCVWVVGLATNLGVVMYGVGLSIAAGHGPSSFWKAILVTGWTVGCAGHIMAMVGRYVSRIRTRLVDMGNEPAGEDIEMR